ncbi:L,D-transpeptidase family protein [Nocardioides sp. Kera G14]|uniref:L,D-transpeptidase family protein n=1 Tax=Nocardioides sp. Kera G14 TaxID=2884264 RepID=UPI001D1244F0|nr:L,D-transpeptidase family protein [Nocardioides sp. Kera G14]UDY22566.1 L,D-transpeptidase family protein [Nocardioides sp. Kera G14]
MAPMHVVRRLGPMLVALVALVAIAPLPSATAATPAADVATFATKVPATTTQVVRTISSHRWCTQIYCTVTQAWQKNATGTWTLVREMRSVIAPRGWGKQREGDMHSPVGVFDIAVTFTTSHRVGAMPWKRRKATSAVPTGGPNYNSWVEVPGRRSGNRPSMRYGFITSYNNFRLHPGRGPKPVPGKGSGIFYHTSPSKARAWKPTEGCTQLGVPAQMKWLLKWLKPAAHPKVVQQL